MGASRCAVGARREWARAAMNSSDSDPDDKVVVDTAELEVASRSSSHRARGEDATIVRARGTRDQIPMGPTATGTSRTLRTGELARDPAEVLRAWPHSMAAREARTTVRAASAASPVNHRVDDKVTLAHLALD